MLPSFSPSTSLCSMDNLSQNHDRMPFEKNEQTLSPYDCLLGLIHQVQQKHLQEALQLELSRFLDSQEQIVDLLQQRTRQLKQENDQLKNQSTEYQRRYEKAVREMQFMRAKHDRALEQQTMKRAPSSDCSSESSGHQTGADSDISTPSVVTSSYASPPPLPKTPIPPTPPYIFTLTPSEDPLRSRPIAPMPTRSVSTSAAQPSPHHWGPMPPLPPATAALSAVPNRPGVTNAHNANADNAPNDAQPVALQRKNPSNHSALSSPTSVYSAPLTPTRSITSANGYTGSSVIQQRRVDPLSFGGSEGLWDTIAKTQGNDATVEKTISNFLRRGGSPNTAKQSPSLGAVKYGYGMIHALIVTKAPSALDLLLQQGANPNAMTLSTADEDKVSPCYIAASVGWLPGLQKLVQAGGDLVHARGHNGSKTALHVAAEHCHAAVVEFVVSYTQGALNQVVDGEGATALHYAAQSGHTDLVTFLARSCQIPIDKADNKGELPIHWATRAGRLEVVTMLVERFGCDVNAYVPKKVGTPLDLAKSGGHKRLVEYLKGMGGLSAKKMDKRQEEERSKRVPRHLESTLARNGLFGLGLDDDPF